MAKVIDGVLYLVQGDDEEIGLTMKDGSGSTVSFSDGDSVTLTLRETPSSEAVLSVTEAVTEATAGASFTLHIASAVTSAAAYGEYSGDIQVVFAGTGKSKTIWPSFTSDRKYITDTNWKNARVVAEVTR